MVSRRGLEWLECRRLSRLPWLVHAFSTRRGGVSRAPAAGLNLGFTEFDRRARVQENRRQFFHQLGAERFLLATLQQTHSAEIYQLVRARAGRLEYRPGGAAGAPGGPAPNAPEPVGDALLTNHGGVLLGVRSADCMPILLVDTRRRVVAAVHAGWRGALERIVEKTVGEMRRLYGTRPPDIVAAIGPSIRACCYEVGDEVRDKFSSRFTASARFFQKPTQPSTSLAERYPLRVLTRQPPGHERAGAPGMRLDLVAVARHQLRSAGVPASHIEVADFCTACRTDLFYSHRQEGSRTGRTMAVIGLRRSMAGRLASSR